MGRIALSMLAVVIAVVAVIFLRSPSTRTNIAAEASAMMPIAEMHAKIDPAKLPVEDFEDQALVFTAKQKD
jgi:cytochrome oxidase Cu insertion factor (SCO1/SenC/PrrC family)